MKSNCDICRGAGSIRLPIFRRPMASPNPSITLNDISRVYPCPECAETVPSDRLAVLQDHYMVDAHNNDPEFARDFEETAAHRLVAGLLEGGFIRFERGPVNHDTMRYRIVVTVGVVSREHVATLEERIVARQDEVVNEVISGTTRQMNLWRSKSWMDDGLIYKEIVVQYMSNALAAAHLNRLNAPDSLPP